MVRGFQAGRPSRRISTRFSGTAAPAGSRSCLRSCRKAGTAGAVSANREPASAITLPEGTMEDKLQYLRNLAQNWKPARELNSLRDTMVFATGNPHTKLMLIGEAPGYYEEVQQEPFVGRAGEKLNQILRAMGLSRDMVYISNIVKFRPALPNQRTNNRAPTPEEIEACLPIIMHEIRVIQPKMIVALGGTAAVGLLGEQGSVSSMRGRFHDLNGIPVRVTYHPSYLLRSDSPREKRKVWEDMLAVMERLDMPISENSAATSCPGHNHGDSLMPPFSGCGSQTAVPS